MSVTATLIEVIDYDCDLHEWVRSVDPELWEASLNIIKSSHSFENPGITQEDLDIPVQLYVNTEYGIDCYMVDKFDTWYSTRVGHNTWDYSWVVEPNGSRSYDDCYPGGTSFNNHAELISFIARKGAEETHEYDYSTSYHRISNPMCSLPQFQSFRETNLCSERYISTYKREPLKELLWGLQWRIRNIFSPFRLLEDEYGDESRPIMDGLRRIWNYTPWADWPGQGFFCRYTTWERYSSPDEEYDALMRTSPYRRDDIEQYWDEIRFNSACWRSYLLMPDVLRNYSQEMSLDL